MRRADARSALARTYIVEVSPTVETKGPETEVMGEEAAVAVVEAAAADNNAMVDRSKTKEKTR